MATFEIVEGAPGQGKSLYTAKKTSALIRRNKKYYARLMKQYELALEAKERSRQLRINTAGYVESEFENQWSHLKEPQKRRVASNMKFAEDFENRHDGWIVYWSDMQQLCQLRDVDVIWDEIATELDARNWVNLSSETKRFLSQYRKRGVDIYANTQDFSMIDARARLMITGVKTLKKIIGSPDISTTKPPPKVIWGIVLILKVNNFKQTDVAKKKYSLLDFSFLIIERDLVEIYDTRQDIVLGLPPPLRHEDRYCEFYNTPGHPCYRKSHKITHS